MVVPQHAAALRSSPSDRLVAGDLSAASVRALASAVGNHAVARLLAPSRLLQREVVVQFSETEKGFADDEAQAAEMREAWQFILDRGVRVDSAAAVAALRGKYASKGVAQEDLDQIIVQPWRRDELVGLKHALAAVGGVRGLAPKMIPGGGVGVAKVQHEWVVGKTSGTLTNEGNWDERTTGETVWTGKQSTMSMTGDCERKASEFEPEPGSETAGEGKARKARAARAIWVHEMGHTIHAAFFKDWQAFFQTAKDEDPPTDYARTNVVEDFCDSFMLYALYPRQLEKHPKRKGFFDARKGHLPIDRTAVAAI